MKNKGFTLSEVLITLGIVAVIAALTIPTMINNSKHKEFETAFLNTYSILDNASDDLIADDNEGSIAGEYNTPEDLLNALKAKLKVSKTCTPATSIGTCWAADVKTLSNNMNFGNVYYNPSDANSSDTIILDDGVSLFVDKGAYDGNCTGAAGNPYHKPGADHNFCALVFVDTNGVKSPNIMGRDVFTLYYIDKVGFVPDGDANTDDYGTGNWDLCTTSASSDNWNGGTCGGRILQEDGMNY